MVVEEDEGEQHLGLEILGEEDVGGLDVPVNDGARRGSVEVVQRPGDGDGDVEPALPRQRRLASLACVGRIGQEQEDGEGKRLAKREELGSPWRFSSKLPLEKCL